MSSIKKLKFKTALFIGSIGSYISSYEIPDLDNSSSEYKLVFCKKVTDINISTNQKQTELVHIDSNEPHIIGKSPSSTDLNDYNNDDDPIARNASSMYNDDFEDMYATNILDVNPIVISGGGAGGDQPIGGQVGGPIGKRSFGDMIIGFNII